MVCALVFCDMQVCGIQRLVCDFNTGVHVQTPVSLVFPSLKGVVGFNSINCVSVTLSVFLFYGCFESPNRR